MSNRSEWMPIGRGAFARDWRAGRLRAVISPHSRSHGVWRWYLLDFDPASRLMPRIVEEGESCSMDAAAASCEALAERLAESADQ